MCKRIFLALSLALFLAAGPGARAGTHGAGLSYENAPAAAATATADGGADAKPKGNGLVRVLTAPFRALGRLFGGGKERREAKKKVRGVEAGARASEAVAAAVEPPREKAEEAPRKEPAAAHQPAREPSAAREAKGGAAPGESAAPPSVVSPAASARVARPGDGRPVPPAPPKWVPVIEGIGRDPLTQGRALLEHGYPNEAISELSVATVVGTDLVEANNLLGLAYDRLGLRKQAIAAYERALTAAPDDPRVLNNLGYSLSLDGRQREALRLLRRAERRAPGAPHVLQNIAFVQARLGKYGDAYKTFARAFGEYDARLKTGALLEEAGRATDALKHYEAALKLRPDSPALLERLVAIYERQGRTREAEAARRALSNPTGRQKTATGGGG